MPTTRPIRTHGDRNVVPETTDISVDRRECPIDEFTLSHMRAAGVER